MELEILDKKLLDAAEKGNLPLIQSLLAQGANISYRDYDGRNALFYAVMNNRLEEIDFLKKAGININERDIDGETALITAVRWNNNQAIEKLILLGADMNISDHHGMTALMHSIKYRNFQAVYNLLKNNANCAIRDNSNMTAKDWAVQCQYTFLLPYLESSKDDRAEALDKLRDIVYSSPRQYREEDESTDEDEADENSAAEEDVNENAIDSGENTNLPMMPFMGYVPQTEDDEEDDDEESYDDDESDIPGEKDYVPTQEDFDNAFTEKDVSDDETVFYNNSPYLQGSYDPNPEDSIGKRKIYDVFVFFFLIAINIAYLIFRYQLFDLVHTPQPILIFFTAGFLLMIISAISMIVGNGWGFVFLLILILIEIIHYISMFVTGMAVFVLSEIRVIIFFIVLLFMTYSLRPKKEE
jgi:hypothetical protein